MCLLTYSQRKGLSNTILSGLNQGPAALMARVRELVAVIWARGSLAKGEFYPLWFALFPGTISAFISSCVFSFNLSVDPKWAQVWPLKILGTAMPKVIFLARVKKRIEAQKVPYLIAASLLWFVSTKPSWSISCLCPVPRQKCEFSPLFHKH